MEPFGWCPTPCPSLSIPRWIRIYTISGSGNKRLRWPRWAQFVSDLCGITLKNVSQVCFLVVSELKLATEHIYIWNKKNWTKTWTFFFTFQKYRFLLPEHLKYRLNSNTMTIAVQNDQKIKEYYKHLFKTRKTTSEWDSHCSYHYIYFTFEPQIKLITSRKWNINLKRRTTGTLYSFYTVTHIYKCYLRSFCSSAQSLVCNC